MRGAESLDLAGLAALAPRDPVASQLLSGYVDDVALGIANLQQVLGIGLFILTATRPEPVSRSAPRSSWPRGSGRSRIPAARSG